MLEVGLVVINRRLSKMTAELYCNKFTSSESRIGLTSREAGTFPHVLKSRRPRMRERMPSTERNSKSPLAITVEFCDKPPLEIRLSVRIGLLKFCQVSRSTGAWQLKTVLAVST